MNFDNTEIAFAPKSTRDLNKAHFLFSSMAKPWLTSLGIQCTYLAFKLHLPIKNIIKKTIFNQFCGGETLDEASISAQKNISIWCWRNFRLWCGREKNRTGI